MYEKDDFVNYYQANSLHLIRIAKDGHDAGKRPQDLGWQKTPLGYDAARAWANAGGNLGWCVGSDYLVIDIDPRNGGDESFDHLRADLGVKSKSLKDSAPVVVTGGGGRHIYFKRPAGVNIKKGALRGYPGVDIQTGPSQVVIPGSIHPSGLPYVPDPSSPWPGSPVKAPSSLISLLSKVATASPSSDTVPPSTTLAACVSLEQCATLLEYNNPARLENYEQWISRLAAIHHATGGAGLDLAIQWSSKDPHYSEVAEAQVRRRWRSFDSPHDFPATVNTLLSDVRDVPAAAEIVAAVELEIAQAEFNDLNNLKRELLERIDQLPGGGWERNQVAAKSIVTDSLTLDEISHTAVIKHLAKELGIRYAVIQKFVTATRKSSKAKKKDKTPLHKFVVDVRDRALRRIRDSGKCIVRAPNEQYYIYNGQYWEAQSREYVTNLVHRSTHILMAENPGISFETTGTTAKAEKSLCSEVFVKSKDLFFRGMPLSTINTKNGTIWVNGHTGEHELKPHYPGDYLATQIPIKYDPAVTCPSFDTMLDQVFGHIVDDFQRSELIRHFWELIGYVIQPHKNIPLIMLWYGGGFNGKSTISNFLSDLVGPMCACPVEMHELGSGKDAHALEAIEGKLILIDDDLKSDAKLSDGVLKKFSETKLVQVNPKHKKSYPARVNVTPIILTNGYPVIRDLSKGLQRRIDVVPFESDLTQYQASNLPKIAREQEMSGILNRALEGLKRLRVRGGFARPQCSIDASAVFFSESNNVAAFLKFATIPDHGNAENLYTAFSNYVQFCVTSGERNHTERLGRFRAMVAQLGYEVKNGKIYGLRIQAHVDDY